MCIRDSYESIPTPASQSWTIGNNEISLFGTSAKGISINSAENVTIRDNEINISHPFTSDYTGIYIAGHTTGHETKMEFFFPLKFQSNSG